VKVSADRILYLARIVLKTLKENRNLEQSADDETVRRAVVRELTDTYGELDASRRRSRRRSRSGATSRRRIASTSSAVRWRRASQARSCEQVS
jgi:hypothetical protein